MLDIQLIRDNPDKIQKAAKAKRVDVDVQHVLEIDAEYRKLAMQVQQLREERNKHTESIKGKKPSTKQITDGRKLKEELEKKEHAMDAVYQELQAWLLKIPNMPIPEVPYGKDESENVVLRKWGEPTKFSFTPKDHIELGKELDVIDIETAAKVSGSRFYYLKNDLVFLEFALVQYVMQSLSNETIVKKIADSIEPGYNATPFIPILPPVMIKPDVYVKTARLDPDVEIERYKLERDDMYLIGSAEHTLCSMYLNETLPEKLLPKRYIGFSTSFRREAGSYGKDTKGILRVHQFDKIEMETFCLPENSIKEQDFLVAIQEYFMQQLNLPYQVVIICTGDMSAPDARQIDIETWIPTQNKYRETHSADLMTDYQARRLGTRVKRKNGSTEFVHTNDATAFAIGRILIAILENYQQEDGSIIIPQVLQKLLGKEKITPKKNNKQINK